MAKKRKAASKKTATKRTATKKAATKKAATKKAAPKKKKVLRATTAAAPATGPAAVIDIPPPNTFNQHLSSASERTMLNLLGVPGQKTKDCSPATGDFKRRVISRVDVGPFNVSGLDVAVQSLKAVFADAKQQIPDVVAAAKTEGMLCVRHKRSNPNSFSNHSWGTAIDLFFGNNGVIDQGVRKTHRGCLQLAPFFNKHGWFWGAGFSGGSVDSMHFELAEETIRNPPPTS